MSSDALCAVVLAAGLGTRLRPLTDVLPKALCPVDNVPLLDRALASVDPFADDVAVNVHYRADDVCAHLAGSTVHISDERSGLLGSGGALGHLHDWIDGRAVLVRNADTYLSDPLDVLVSGWSGDRPRVLVVPTQRPTDFGLFRYVGACLLPAHLVQRLPDGPAALLDRIWQPAWDAGELELVTATGACIDCGTPREYLRANLHASGGDSVVGAGAVVEGAIDRVVVWPNGRVSAGEHLSECIRVGDDLTVDAR